MYQSMVGRRNASVTERLIDCSFEDSSALGTTSTLLKNRSDVRFVKQMCVHAVGLLLKSRLIFYNLH